MRFWVVPLEELAVGEDGVVWLWGLTTESASGPVFAPEFPKPGSDIDRVNDAVGPIEWLNLVMDGQQMDEIG